MDARGKLNPVTNKLDPTPYISDLAVRPDYRRLGLATCMIEKCERVAKMWGHSSIWLKVEVSNKAAKGMYADLGYATEPTGEDGISVLTKAIGEAR